MPSHSEVFSTVDSTERRAKRKKKPKHVMDIIKADIKCSNQDIKEIKNFFLKTH